MLKIEMITHGTKARLELALVPVMISTAEGLSNGPFESFAG